MHNANTIKSTGVFVYDLVAAWSFPQREPENTLVKYFLREFPHPLLILKKIEGHREKLSKSNGHGLRIMFREHFIRALNIDEKLRTFVQGIRLFRNRGITLGGAYKDEFKWYLLSFPFLLALIEELIKRASQKKWGDVTQPVAIIFYLLWEKRSEIEANISDIQKILGIDAAKIVYDALQKGIKRIENMKTFKGKSAIDKEIIGEIYYDEFKGHFDEKLGNSSTEEILNTMWEDDMDLEYLPNKTSQAAYKKLIQYELLVSSDAQSFKEAGYVEFMEKDAFVRQLGAAIVEYVNSLSAQASKQKLLGRFLHEKIGSGEIFHYIIETQGGKFRLDTQGISENSKVSLRSVERFFRDFTNCYGDTFQL